MENILKQQPLKRWKKRDVTIAIVIMLLLQILLFAYLYMTKQSLVNILPKIGFGPPKPLFGIYGTGSMGNLQRPMGVIVYDRKVFVSDTGKRRIAVFDYDGKPLYTFGESGTKDGQFQFPYGISIDDAGQVYVADMYTGKISVFSQEGKFIKYFADGEKNFQSPAGLFFFDNHLFVTDVGLQKVMAFDTSGKKVLEFGKKGQGDGELLSPNAINVTKDFIYVSDTGNHRVEKFDRTGKFLAVNIGDVPAGRPSAFSNTRGVGVDNRGILYVVSNMTNKVWAFDKDGKKQFEFGQLGQEDDQFSLPNGLCIDYQGRIYIVDTQNQRVMVYES